MAEQSIAQETLNTVAKTLPEALAKILDKAVDGIEAGVNFLSAQIPDVIHQLLLYNLVWSLIWWTFSLVCIIFIVTWNVKFWRSNDFNEDAGVALAFFTFIASAILIPIFATHWDWLKIWLAPKIYLIEYASDLYKSMKGR